MPLHSFFQTKNSSLSKTFRRSNWIWKVKGRLHFRKYPAHQCSRMLQRRSSCFWIKIFQKWWIWCLEPGLNPSITECWNHEHSQSRLTQSQQSCITVKLSRKTQKKMRFALWLKDLVLHSLIWKWAIFLKLCSQWNWGYAVRRRASQTKVCLRHFPHTLPHDIHISDWV